MRDVAFLGRQRAERIDEQPARFHVSLHRRQQSRLQRGEPIDVLGRAPQLHLGMAPQRAQAGAGRVEQDKSETLQGNVGQGQRRVGRARFDIRQTHPPGRLGDGAGLARVEVHGQHGSSRPDDLREVARLAPGRGAGVENARTGGRSGIQRDELRRLVLRLEEALFVSLDVEGGRRARGQHQRVGAVSARLRLDARLAQRLARLGKRAAPHAHHRGRLPLVRLAQLLRLIEPEPARPALDHPARMRRASRDVPDRIGLARWRLGRRALLGKPPQHGVDEARGASCLQLLGQLDRLVDHRPLRHARMMEQLERAHAQRNPRRRVDFLERAIAVRRQRAIELELPAQRPVSQLGGQRRLARLEHAGLAQRRVERQVGERAVVLHPQEHLRCDPARGRCHRARFYLSATPSAPASRKSASAALATLFRSLPLDRSGCSRYCGFHEDPDPEPALEIGPPPSSFPVIC